MSPDPPQVDETERVQGPLTLSETCTWPDAPNWPNHPTSRSPADTASQLAAAPRVAVPCWAPAALDVMSSANAEPFEVWARGVYGTPALLPGVTERGSSPVIKAANTSSPASTAAVAPVSTVVPIPRADAIWSSAPARAMPE